jgi:hypothetical protein
MKINTSEDIIKLNEYWYKNDHFWLNKKHKTNNPNGYVKEPVYNNPDLKEAYRLIRLNDLNLLLELIYEKYELTKEQLKLTAVEKERFYKYIFREIISNFPYKCFKDFTLDQIKTSKTLPGYNNWIAQILTYKTESKTGRNTYTKDTELLKLRRDIILEHFVAEIAHFINKLQVDDLANNINKPEDLIYGKKHALSAFLGQHIIRMFPFKEEIKFQSKSVFETRPKKKVYEHWTPISFFRDLIWIHQPDGKPKVFSVDEWNKILKYAYRTILITKEEDNMLNTNKFKSKRPFDAYKELDIEISIVKDNENLWEELHRI